MPKATHSSEWGCATTARQKLGCGCSTVFPFTKPYLGSKTSIREVTVSPLECFSAVPAPLSENLATNELASETTAGVNIIIIFKTYLVVFKQERFNILVKKKHHYRRFQ